MADSQDVTDTVVAPAQPDPIMDILMEDETSPKAAPSPAKMEEPVKDTPEKSQAEEIEAPEAPDVPIKAETEGEPEAQADDTAAEGEPDETQAQPQGRAEVRKQQLSTEIRDLVSQRNALKTEIEQINSEVYQPATVDELIAQGMGETDAKLEALDQRLQVQDYNNRVAEAQLTIESESQRVLNDFAIFNPDSVDYRKDLADEAAALMSETLDYDQNTGQLIGSKVSPYKLYKTIAAAHNVSAQAGQIKGQQDTEKMLARADTIPNAAPKMDKKDPIMDILLDVDGY